MRFVMFVAAALVVAQAAAGAILENPLHTGTANSSFAWPPVTWQNASTRVTGSMMSQTTPSFLSWDIGIVEPAVVRLRGSGYASALGLDNLSLENTMTVIVTQPAAFTLTGTMYRSFNFGSVFTSVSGPGILGVPTEPDGSLQLSGNQGLVALSGTFLPGEYTVRFGGSAISIGSNTVGTFAGDLVLTVVPAPTVTTPVLIALVLAVRRRRSA